MGGYEAGRYADSKFVLVRNNRNFKLYFNLGYFPNVLKPDDYDEGVYILKELFGKKPAISIKAGFYHEKINTGATGTLPRFIEIQEPPPYDKLTGEPMKGTELYYSTGKSKETK